MNTIFITLGGGFGNNLCQWINGCLTALYLNINQIHMKPHHHPVSHQESMTSIYHIIKTDIFTNHNKLPFDLKIINPIKTEITDMYSPFDINDLHKYRKFINDNLLDYSKIEMPFLPMENDIVLSLRLGMLNEVVRPSPYSTEFPEGMRIPFKFYSAILDKFLMNNENARIVICCDDFDSDFLNQFTNRYKKNHIILAKYSTLTQFNIIRLANNIISPHSSFSHYAILLSDAKNIWMFHLSGNIITVKNREEYYG